MATVVFVPGSFAPSGIFDAVKERLAAYGIPSVAIDLPSVGRREGKPAATMTDDANEIVRVASPILDEGKEVVLLTHSYGGIPGTQSLEKLSHTARQAKGQSGGIKKIIYLSAIVNPVGTSNWDTFQGTMPPFVTVGTDYMTLDQEAQATITFSDIPKDEALAWSKKMPEHSVASFKENLTYPGYNDVKVYYIMCEEDGIVPVEYQHGMIEIAKKSSGREVTVHKIKSGHVPLVSQPDTVAKILKEIVEDA